MIYQEKIKGFKWFALVLLAPLILIYQTTKPDFKHLNSDFYQFVGFSLFLVFLMLIVLFQYLKITFNPDFLQVSYVPYTLLGASKKIKYSDIKHWEILNIDPIYSFGGVGGVRKSKTYGEGYVISTDEFLFLELKSGEKISFNIKNPIKVAEIMRQKATLS
ncbi:hypothetical protein [Ornithobacterium rhinotracheale]|uniref:hypothetical protein n=1 Tax=Ornithobacterium rhinotracheale TaxID=28251 RepID=UPI004036DFFE